MPPHFEGMPTGSGRDGVYDVGIEVAQDVIAASGDLTCDRDRSDLATMTVFEPRVVGVVGTALMGRVLRSFVQRPPQCLGPLAGQVSTGTASIGRIDGYIQTRMTYGLSRAREPSAVAELAPHRHRQQPTDPVLRVDQRPTRRLALWASPRSVEASTMR